VRVAWAALAALIAAGAASLLPFWPMGFAPLLAAVAATLAFVRPRIGLAAALGAAVFPLGNLALGLALVFGAAAPVWLTLTTAGPRALRRATLTASAVVAAHGLGPLDVAGEDSPVTAARVVLGAVPAQAWMVALALAAAAATLPLARTPWRASFWGAGLLAALLLPTTVPALPVVAAVWVASAVLALRAES
jgi:hypothetical protein